MSRANLLVLFAGNLAAAFMLLATDVPVPFVAGSCLGLAGIALTSFIRPEGP